MKNIPCCQSGGVRLTVIQMIVLVSFCNILLQLNWRHKSYAWMDMCHSIMCCSVMCDNYLTTMHWNRWLAISQIWHTQDVRRANHVICRCVLVSCTMAIEQLFKSLFCDSSLPDYHPTNVTKHWACRRVFKYTSWRIIREVSFQLSYI